MQFNNFPRYYCLLSLEKNSRNESNTRIIGEKKLVKSKQQHYQFRENKSWNQSSNTISVEKKSREIDAIIKVFQKEYLYSRVVEKLVKSKQQQYQFGKKGVKSKQQHYLDKKTLKKSLESEAIIKVL